MTAASTSAGALRGTCAYRVAALVFVAALVAIVAIGAGADARALGAQSLAGRAAPAGIARPSTPWRPLFQASTGDKTQATPRPALEPARMAGEILAGAYAGIGGYFLGNWAGGLFAETLPWASDGTKEHVAFAGGIVGAALTTAASVAFIGDIGDQTGSYPAALAGTAGGIAAGLLLNQLLYGHARLPTEHGSSRVRWIEASLEAMLPSIGATIAFNSTRRFK